MAPLGHKRGHLKKEMEAPMATEIAEKARRDLKGLTRTGQAPQVDDLVTKRERFRDTASRHANVVCCVRCGSTNVDQNSLDELHCYECGNCLAWDGLVFTIARTLGVDLEDQRCTPTADDAERAFRLRERTPPWVAADEVEAE